MKFILPNIVTGSLFLPYWSSCNNLKKVLTGDALYTGGSVKIDSTVLKKKEKKSLKRTLHALLRPKPNKKFWVCGLNYLCTTWPVILKESPLRGWLKNKVGEPLCCWAKLTLERNIKVLQNTLRIPVSRQLLKAIQLSMEERLQQNIMFKTGVR